MMVENYINSHELLERAEILYTFVDLFSNYENTPRDYGSGELFSMMEIHLLNHIYQNPGITPKELSEKIHRTKGFVSHILTKMEDLGYIIKISEKTNLKSKHLYITAPGQQLCIAHNNFDEQTLLKTYNYLLRDCTPEEIATFHKVMQVYNNIMNAAARKRKRLAAEKAEKK